MCLCLNGKCHCLSMFRDRKCNWLCISVSFLGWTQSVRRKAVEKRLRSSLFNRTGRWIYDPGFARIRREEIPERGQGGCQAGRRWKRQRTPRAVGKTVRTFDHLVQRERFEGYGKFEANFFASYYLNCVKDVFKIEKAVVSQRLTKSPCALVASTYGWSGNMERIMKSQAYAKAKDSTQDYYASQKKTLEINPRHPVIKDLLSRVKADKEDKMAYNTASLLFETATLRSGFSLKDSVGFAERIELMLKASLSLDPNEMVRRCLGSDANFR